MKVNIGAGRAAPSLVGFLLISSFCHPVVSQYPGFFWENEYLVKPVPFFDGAELKIAVIEGDVVKIQCNVKVDPGEQYNIRWDYFDFNATDTGTSITGEHAESNVTLYIDNPAKIDEKKIVCLKLNSDPIELQVIVYVNDSNVPCGPCDGPEEIKLKRLGNKKTQDQSLQKGFEDNLTKKLAKQNYKVEIVPDADVKCNTFICGCKEKVTTTDADPGAIAGGVIGGLFGFGLLGALGFWLEKKFGCLGKL